MSVFTLFCEEEYGRKIWETAHDSVLAWKKVSFGYAQRKNVKGRI